MDNQIAVTSILSLFETTKEERTSFKDKVIMAIDAGEIDPRKVLVQFKNIEDIIKQVSSDETFKLAALCEAQKNGKAHEFMNAKITIREVGVSYDYSKCGDNVYLGLLEEKELLTNKLKEREFFLKNIPPTGVELFNEDTGEVVKIYPPSKTSTTSATISLK